MSPPSQEHGGNDPFLPINLGAAHSADLQRGEAWSGAWGRGDLLSTSLLNIGYSKYGGRAQGLPDTYP